jgi:SET domain-containing protein
MKAGAASARPRAVISEWIRRGRSSIHGGGLYAQKAIPAGTRVIEYVGERITKAEAERREKHRLVSRAAGRDGCVYVFELNKRHDIDGDVKWNTARMINHSCESNCEPQVIRGHIWIIARRDIAAGEELTYDYGFDYADWREHPCRCGARSCAGFIVNKNQRWRVRRILRVERRRKA